MKTSTSFGIAHANELVGGFAILAVGILAVAIVQTGRIQRWFNPGEQVRILLPDEGLMGLSAGAEVEVLGTNAGRVEEIVIDPNQRIYASIRIREDMARFIRGDSTAVIRKRFGVAGASFLEITRGTADAPPMDWDFAVMEARADRAPTDALQLLVEDLRTEVLPMVKDARRAAGHLASIAEEFDNDEGELQRLLANIEAIVGNIAEGEGVIGQLVTNPELVDQIKQSISQMRASSERLKPIVANIENITGNTEQITEKLAERSDEVPEILTNLRESLENIKVILEDAQKSTPRLNKIAENVEQTTEDLPGLVLQSQVTLTEVEKLIKQLQQSWLLGGSGAATQESSRIPASEVLP